MKTWIKRSLIGAFGASVLIGGALFCAHRYHAPWSPHATEADQTRWRSHLVRRAGHKLSLDDAQRAKLGVLFDTVVTQRKAMRGSGPSPRDELQSLLAGAQLDRAKAQSLLDAKTRAVSEAAPAVIGAAAEFFDSLKPEQQQKLRELLARGGRRHGWRV